MTNRKKLIEVTLRLDAINVASARRTDQAWPGYGDWELKSTPKQLRKL